MGLGTKRLEGNPELILLFPLYYNNNVLIVNYPPTKVSGLVTIQ